MMKIPVIYFYFLDKDKMHSRISYYMNFLRTIILVVDMSEQSGEKDRLFSPCKLDFLKSKILEFSITFFSNNLISSLAIIGVMDYQAKVICPFSWDHESVKSFIELNWVSSSGFFSFFNALSVK